MRIQKQTAGCRFQHDLPSAVEGYGSTVLFAWKREQARPALGIPEKGVISALFVVSISRDQIPAVDTSRGACTANVEIDQRTIFPKDGLRCFGIWKYGLSDDR